VLLISANEVWLGFTSPAGTRAVVFGAGVAASAGRSASSASISPEDS